MITNKVIVIVFLSYFSYGFCFDNQTEKKYAEFLKAKKELSTKLKESYKIAFSILKRKNELESEELRIAIEIKFKNKKFSVEEINELNQKKLNIYQEIIDNINLDIRNIYEYVRKLNALFTPQNTFELEEFRIISKDLDHFTMYLTKLEQRLIKNIKRYNDVLKEINKVKLRKTPLSPRSTHCLIQ